MADTFYITHYINQEPSKSGWREIPFITKKLNLEDENYYLGLEFDTPIPIEVIDKGVEENYYIVLNHSVKADSTQSVWITPTGEIWLANYENPFENNRIQIDKVVVQITPLDLIKEYCNFNPSLVNFDELPEELNKAWKRLVNQIEEEPESINYFKADQINVIKYSFLSEFDLPKKNLEYFLNTLLVKNDIKFLSPTEERITTYDIDERSGLFFSKSIFLYPYYLDHLRKKYSGVIPYAYQTSLAVVIHKENQSFKKWQLLREKVQLQFDVSLDDWEQDVLVEQELAINWLKDLMLHVHSTGGKINFVKGYIFDAVTNEFQSKHLESKILVDHLNQSSKDIEKLSELDFFKQNTARHNQFHKDKNSILILDPAEAFGETVNNPYILNKLDKETYTVLNIKHGLKIPIGIGFSLYALPFLLSNDNWRSLQEIVLNNFRNEDVIRKLRYLGIELINHSLVNEKISV